MSPSNISAVRSYGGSYIGRRRNNEDSLGKREPGDLEVRRRRGCLYVVCDGMGGHSAGEIASRLAVETILKEYYAAPGEPAESLVASIQLANSRIFQEAGEDLDRAGMGCTVIACVILEDRALIAHVGDSRAYLFRDGELKLLTRDHLHITEDLGLDQEVAKRHRLRHMLSRALGKGPEVQVDCETRPWAPGDRFLLCSDGLSNALSEAEFGTGLSEPGPREAVVWLLRQAEENQADDNSSGIVVAISAAPPQTDEPEPSRDREGADPPGRLSRWLRGFGRRRE
jgi:protein phosphatase